MRERSFLRNMDRKINKIQFIICANDSRELEECRFYIDRLYVPDGMQTELTIITDARSMTEGYNRGMGQSDAKYRIYLHQDTCLIYRDMLRELIDVFEKNESIGMVGVVGVKQIPNHAVAHSSWDTGWVDTNEQPLELKYQPEHESGLELVEAVDGLFIATQYDVPWREDLFTKWDFYDISQALEMRRRGYQVAVPYQSQPWCWHDNETSRLADYEGERRIFASEYQDIRAFDRGEVYHYQSKQDQLLEEFQAEIMHMVDEGRMTLVEQLLEQYHSILGSKAELIRLENIFYVRKVEKHAGVESQLYGDGKMAKELLEAFREDKFLVKRMEYGDDKAADRLLERYQLRELSEAAMLGLAVCYAKDRTMVMEQWNEKLEIYRK